MAIDFSKRIKKLPELTYTPRRIQVDNDEEEKDELPDTLEEIPEYEDDGYDDDYDHDDDEGSYNNENPWMPSSYAIENWRDYFPLPDFRQWQEQTIENILKGWASGKKYAIVEGPTGSGKSVIALTLGRLFGNAFISTPQKMLQNQYMKDFSKYLFELKGRVTYPCLRINYDEWKEGTGRYRKKTKRGKVVEEEITESRDPIPNVDFITLEEWNKLDPSHEFRRYTCASAPCNTKGNGKTLKAECKKHGVCEYIRRRDYALKISPLSVLNFSNLILFSLLMPHVFPRRPLLILDECHTLESFLYNFATITVGIKQLKPLFEFMNDDDAARITQPFNTMDDFIQYLKDVVFPSYLLYEKSVAIEDVKEDENENESDGVEDAVDAAIVEPKDEKSRLKKLIAKLKDFVNAEPTDHSYVLVPKRAEEGTKTVTIGIEIKPFSVAHLSKVAFNSSNSRVLLMSATILDPNTFCKSVGIPLAEAFFIQVPSTFPPENRLIIGDLSVGSMTYRHKDRTMPKMLDRILELSEKHITHKGIIHTGNYENMHSLKRWVKDADRVLYERLLFQSQKTFEEKERLIDIHTISDEPLILCGPGFLEGIDLKDDLARFNMIMKMPFLSLADPLIKRKAEEFPEWYALQVALALIQAIGRPVRSKTDWALTYILDLMWKFFYGKHKNVLFPKHIQEAIRWISSKNPVPFKLD